MSRNHIVTLGYRLANARALAVLTAASAAVGCAAATAPPTPSGVPEIKAITYIDRNRTPANGDLAVAAIDYLRSEPALTGPGDDWKVRATSVRGGTSHVRVLQLHEGVRVWGGDLVVHVTSDRFTSAKGNLVKHLAGFDVSPAISDGAALAAAKADYKGKLKVASQALAFSRENTELVIYPQRGRDARLAWHAVFFTEVQAGMPPGLWNYVIDAKTGDILHQFNGIHTLAQASGPGGNTKTPRTWTMELDVEPSGSAFKMETSRLVTVNMNNQTSGDGTIVTGPLNAIGDAAINDAHGYAEKTLNMMQDWMGQNSIDGNGFVIRSRVHYDSNYENAFWDGTQMTYGDGASTFFPLSGDVDVVAHEINHGFTEFHSGLIYDAESGGMNEAFSDISGTITEFFDEGAGADFDIGRDIFKGDQALRFMCDPKLDGISIDHYSNYTNGIDVHFSSGIMNKAFCLAARRLATGDPTGTATPDSIRRVGTAFYLANASYWTQSSTFQQGCQGVIDAAKELAFTDAERDHLRTSWLDVGVFCDGEIEPIVCDETFTADAGEVTSPNFPNEYPLDFTRTYCIQPASGKPATVTFPAFDTEPGFDFVLVKDGLGNVLSNTSGSVPPPAATSTMIVIKFSSDIVIPASGWRAVWTTGETENEAPTAAISSPATGTIVSNTIAVAATASDLDGDIAKVLFALPDGTTVEDTAAPYSASWNTKTVSDGIYDITATAFDNLGVASAPALTVVEVKNAVSCINGGFAASGLPLPIPDNNSNGVSPIIAVNGVGNVGTLTMSLDIAHSWRGDLRVILVGPDGTQHVVHDRGGGSADDLILGGVEITAFAGRPASGAWQLRVIDLQGEDTGSVRAWSMAIAGNCAPAGDWSAKAEPNLPLVDNGSACSTLTVSGQTGDASAVHLDVDGIHAFRSSLSATLTHNDVTVDVFPTSTFTDGAGAFSVVDRLVGGLSGDVNGAWTLCIVDTDAFDDIGVLTSWGVHD